MKYTVKEINFSKTGKSNQVKEKFDWQNSDSENRAAMAKLPEATDSFEMSESRIEFYGKKADKTKEEYDAMTNAEKLEYIMLQYRPLCLKTAKKYQFSCVDFQDMYMEACKEILKVVERYGIDDKDLSYHIYSRVAVTVKRWGQKQQKMSECISFEEEKETGEIEIQVAEFDKDIVKAELYDELASCLSGRQLEIALYLAECGPQTAVGLAKEFGVSRQTITKDLAAMRKKLEYMLHR